MAGSPEKTPSPGKVNRRTFLKRSATAAAAGAAVVGGGYWLGRARKAPRTLGEKVIIIGIDGMDPVLCEAMMNQDQLPHLKRLRANGAFSKLSTSIPPQSPVAWANFINGAGPGSHGIFDFLHRHPEKAWDFHGGTNPFLSFSETLPGEGVWEVADHNLQLDFFPFNHKPAATVLRRQGVPFWDYLDEQGIPSTFYDLPCNYPPSPSHHGHHRCIAGMGVPDMLGTMGTYHYFAEDAPEGPGTEIYWRGLVGGAYEPQSESGGKRARLSFSADTAKARILGPMNSLYKEPYPIPVEFLVHRDKQANAAVIEIQGRRLMLKPGEWSPWIKLDFKLSVPWFLPGQSAGGICRFYLKEVAPTFKLYMSPINMDPSAPAIQISEPSSFLPDVSKRLGLFHTAGFQEDYFARMNDVFDDDEFIKQATQVLEERLALFEYAVNNYDDGLLYFYFSSSDLQSHIMWWDSNDPHPIRTGAGEAQECFGYVKRLYKKLDEVIGDIVERYGAQATIIVMSDHGFANFGRQFHLNSWLRDKGIIGPPECTSIRHDVDWSKTYAYGLGINGLYLNLKGREKHGIVEPREAQGVINQLISLLEDEVRDVDRGNRPVIRKAYEADKVYTGEARALAPDLIIGYARGYRSSWATTLGDMVGPNDPWLENNDSAWSADHCMDALEVPGVFYSNKAIGDQEPRLIDMAPSILARYKLETPKTMVGRNVFK